MLTTSKHHPSPATSNVYFFIPLAELVVNYHVGKQDLWGLVWRRLEEHVTLIPIKHFESVANRLRQRKKLGSDTGWHVKAFLFCTSFILVSFSLTITSLNTDIKAHAHYQHAWLYLDFRRWQFVCSPASLQRILALFVQVDCSHLALLQEGQQNQPITQHRWEWHHHIWYHNSKTTKTKNIWRVSNLLTGPITVRLQFLRVNEYSNSFWFEKKN